MSDPNYRLICAVREDRLETVRELINTYGLSYSTNWAEGYFLLCHATELKHTKIAQLLLEEGCRVNKINNIPSDTPLHFAVRCGDLEIVTMLLDRNADINAKNKYGITPLHNAIKHAEITELLLNSGAYVNATDNDGNSPLHFAVKQRRGQALDSFLKHGAHANCVNDSRRPQDFPSLKNFAFGRGFVKECIHIIQQLVKHGANVNGASRENYTSLHLAAETGCKEIMELLLSLNADINACTKNNLTPLHIATKNEHPEIVKLLLDHGANVDAQDKNGETILYYGADINNMNMTLGSTPLHIATKSIQHEIIALLINYGANLNIKDKYGNTPILYAIGNTDLKITKLLLTNGANVKNKPGLLISAVFNNCLEIVEILLQEDINVNLTDKLGRTALHYTTLNALSSVYCYGRNKYPDPNKYIMGEICKLLLSRGANVNASYGNGITTLCNAIRHGYENVVEILLKYNANVESTVKYGESPLYISAKVGNKVICEIILKKGVNVNAKQKNKMTALHIATQAGHKEIVELLLKFGADINLRDEHGRTALHIASENGHYKVVEALLESGSDINIETTNKCTALDCANASGDVFFNQLIESMNYYSEDIYKTVVGILKKHIIKRKTANLYVSKKNLQSIQINYVEVYHYACEAEIEILKNQKINSNTHVTFYDILTRNISQLAIYARNEDIVNVFKSNDYKTKFEIYGSIINNNFKMGMERKELLDQEMGDYEQKVVRLQKLWDTIRGRNNRV